MKRFLFVVLFITAFIAQGCNNPLEGSKPLSLFIQKVEEGTIKDIKIFDGMDRAYIAITMDNDRNMMLHSIYGDIKEGDKGAIYVIEPTLYAPFFTYIWEKD